MKKAGKPTNPIPAYKLNGNLFVPLYQRARRSVVSIKNESQDTSEPDYSPWEQKKPARVGIGTGFVIHRNGTILTNSHVVKNSEKVTVTLYNGMQKTGRVIWRDQDDDIALIKIGASKALVPLPLGSSRTSKVGEMVLCIGNPLGFENSITTGVISGKNRLFKFADSDQTFQDNIQIDCSINPGSSGGPLMNLNGQVIGITTFSVKDRQGLGFAIGIDGVKKKILKHIKNTSAT
ncbi:S1C family serine protease [Cohnella nanjingensis]|uniref:Trypsin-like peptidase domain-containing protein n=1 Tax=Cohnella nanjingensis TaxID=1387779 RepID=A0A7X0RNB9_9BACL|nr:trypsin-like peptidase domain-containing protein [Cohnella nanjingensis]MBB6669244.1 trypsin-like peptidase domain-containing protein [Cohnella nanjingensis]